ncbi:hypothetical protein [Mycoplasmopsis cynos]|uniref:hypothetical protein n=1 Tax=Mycoplasmopsis cynos TaxID=171284 RepID=UPI002AFE5711|nr:hypothetical protein [Mycoplasmopsis cynos]WQQ14530.1 hypothetical protein RRG42_02890 [Mycoplasmopsis cynos]WQQ17017.1 hypothetical protein RRG39_00540 [Mycoplasmopsis cynos]
MNKKIVNKLPLLFISILVLLLFNIVPIFYGNWTFNDPKYGITYRNLYIVLKVISGFILISFIIYYLFSNQKFSHSGILLTMIITIVSIQLVPIIWRSLWYVIDITNSHNKVYLWFSCYLIILTIIYFGIISLCLIVNKKMVKREEMSLPDRNNHNHQATSIYEFKNVEEDN